MKKEIVVIGMGEIGSVFARGFLKLGYTVHPVVRSMSLAERAQAIPNPELVVLAAGENDVHKIIQQQLPEQWHKNVVLLQNELLPHHWKGHLTSPTVISVWFEKKKGQDSKVVLPSPAYGPHAKLLQQALATLDLPVRIVETEAQLLFELVRKNAYILTSNIAGLKVGGTVGDLWEKHQAFALAVVHDVLHIQSKLTNQLLDNDALIAGMVEAFLADPAHKCMGRTAPDRLARALEQAKIYGEHVETLQEIQRGLCSKGS